MTTMYLPPVLRDTTAESMVSWFAAMAERGLLFHPDDDPVQVVRLRDGKPLFSAEESMLVSEVLDALFDAHGELVYQAALPYFMDSLGLPH